MAAKDSKKVSKTKFWISDLFQPKFTEEDLFFKQDDNDQKDISNLKIANDFYSKIYSKVILEEQLSDDGRQYKKKTKNLIIEDQFSELEDLEGRKNHEKKITVEESDKSNVKDKTVWNVTEIGLLRKAYSDLRERTLWLLCLLENRNVKILDLKNKILCLEEERNNIQETLQGIKRENMQIKSVHSTILKINKDVESKLEFYEDCNNGLKEAIQNLQKENDELIRSISRKTTYFEKYRKTNAENCKSLEKKKNAIYHNLSAKYETKISSLNGYIEKLEKDLLLKNKECIDHKNGLKELGKCFLEFQKQHEEKEGNYQMKILEDLCFLDINNVSDHPKEQFLNVTNI